MVRYTALKNLYETEKTIGTGGFAKVKLARHLLTGEKVAIKILDKECLGDDLPRVKLELEALKNLSHHHICRLFQVIETEQHYFLVMEYCAGGELFDYIVQSSRLSEMEARSIFRQILSAVAFLHNTGYVHRDIKPENVLLDKDQCVKLIDFGLCAKPSPGIESHLETSCGSPTYAAPELIKGDSYLGSGVDVWSLGVVLYTLLCGSLPFDSEKIDVLYKQIFSGNYKTPEHLSQGSRTILRAMLETDPAKRISVEQLLSHPWVTLGYNEAVCPTSLYKDEELDQDCMGKMAAYYGLMVEEVRTHVSACQYDSIAATYQLLVNRKKQGLPLRLGEHMTRTRLQSMRRAVAHAGLNDPKGTYSVLPPHHQQPVKSSSANGKGTYTTLPTDKKGADEKENQDKTMQPPNSTPARRKRPHGAALDNESPVPKRAATLKEDGNSVEVKTPNSKPFSIPSTPTNRMSSPGTRILKSIERKFQKVRKVLTPQRRGSAEYGLPTLLTTKNLCNTSTTSSSSPDHVRDELIRALESRGIECICKGYSIRGKLQAAGVKECKLSFELEVCLIPTSANTNGSVVGIRRKRLKGDAWCYKRVCEEILNMADLK